MELASLLAGEQWSDHPACTHLLLGVSPAMSTTTPLMPAAPRLARPIPSVIG